MISEGDTIWFRNRNTGAVECAIVCSVPSTGDIFWCNYNGKKVRAPKNQLGKKLFFEPSPLDPHSNLPKHEERRLTCSDCQLRKNETCYELGSTICQRFSAAADLPLATWNKDDCGFGTGKKNR